MNASDSSQNVGNIHQHARCHHTGTITAVKLRDMLKGAKHGTCAY